MGSHFLLSMFIAIAIIFISCVLPCSVPMMFYFICASLCCSWTVFNYYKYPANRCSTNGDLFGIATEDTNDNGLRQPNIWIMSQTTYSSFFALILLCSFSICGSVTLILQWIAKYKKKSANIAQRNADN